MIESQPRRVIVEPFTDESEARRCSPDPRYNPAMFFLIRGKGVRLRSMMDGLEDSSKMAGWAYV